MTKCLFKGHQWKVIRVERYTEADFHYPISYIYRKCERCQKVKKKRKQGDFYLEDFTTN